MKFKATDADFRVAPHEHDALDLGTVKVCTVCGALGQTRVIWGRAPGQPRLSPDAEAEYRMEQAS
jgi:hypothetical protein